MIEKLQLTESDINANYEEFLAFLKESFKGERLEKLLAMCGEDCMGLQMATAPASTCEHFHLARPGGYLIHVMHVIKASFEVRKLYGAIGGNIDFNEEEMVFSSCFHDLGKIGVPGIGDYYVMEDADWKIRKGEVYKLNPELQYMEVTDRALFLLNKYGVSMTWKEMLGIRLADGLFQESNVKYLRQYNPDFFLKTNLPLVVHWADWMSSRAEYDTWKAGQ
jgi:hypothetical protein